MYRSSRPKMVAVVAVTMAGFLVAAPSASAASAGLVINEVYGGGGNSGAPYLNDFVELTNRGTTPVSVDGWAVQYHSASANGSWQVTPLSGLVAPGALYVVVESAGANTAAPPVTGQATGSIFISATGATVALVASTTALTCTDQTSCDAASQDLVGYGSPAIFDGAAVGGASNTQSVGRTAGPDTDHNAADFGAGDPTPGEVNAGGIPPVTGLRIHDIQGTGFRSAYAGQTVAGVPGIVTGVRTGNSGGYFVQDPEPDNDPATSEGVYVFTAATPTVHAGDSVLVAGTVSEYYPDAAPVSAQDFSTTEIGHPTTTVLSTGNPLPAAEKITPTTVPSRYAPDLGGADMEDTPITPSRSALDFWESREAMLVEVDDARVVGPTDRYGEQYVTTKPAEKPSFRGGTLLIAENATPAGRVEVVPLIANVSVDVGDVYAGATVGPVDYSEFGGWTIAATQLGPVEPGGLTPTVLPAAAGKQLTVATYNVENLAPTDPGAKFAALATGIVENLAAPDIVALEEVQDNNGTTDDGVVDSTATLTALTKAIVAAGGPQYSWREIDPVDDQDGGQPGGNIRNVFLFNPSRVNFVDRGAATVDRSTVGTKVVGSPGRPDLTLSPGRIDPTNTAWDSSRKPLVGEFIFRGKTVFVIANHFDSKLGDGNADGRFQYPTQSSAVQRAHQATVVHDFVLSLLKRNPLAQTVVLGDLNDYQFSPALSVLETGRSDGRGLPILTDLITTLPANQQYTYVFDGISEVLDHILVTPGVFLTGRVSYQVAHINSEFAAQTSDHDPQRIGLFG